MTTRKLGDTITKDFVTLNPSTGAAVDADSTPTAAVYEDDTDTGLSGITVTKRTGLTGDYRVAITATAGNGFEVGKSYNVIVSATVDGVAAKACIFSFTLDSKRLVDLNDIAAGAAMTLTSGEHTAISGTDVPAGLTAQGYTTTRAGYLDTLNGLVTAIWAAATRTLSAFGFTVATNSDNNITAIKVKTDNLPAHPAATGDAMVLTGAYDAAKTAASQASVDALPILAEIEASPVLAKEATAAEAIAVRAGYALSDAVFDARGNMLSGTITTATKTYAITATYDSTTGRLLTYNIAEV